MTEILNFILYPLVAAMEFLLGLYATAFSSAGGAIFALGATTALAAYPLRQHGKKIESRLADKNRIIKESLVQLDKTLSGEALFLATDKIYQEHKFHPIHNILSGASFLFQLPFLIAAFLMLTSDVLPADSTFLFIKDLSQPDNLFTIFNTPINILPLCMLALSLLEAKYFYARDPASIKKFILISALIFILVYGLPSGLVLYWIALNLFAVVLGEIFIFIKNK
ncbi:MAG: YidC/Oxa1 family membrane protein insertase [Gammaproteobacteria bacterium WSBS_2016_MAG_OTU1]